MNFGILLSLTLTVFCTPSFATLGENESSIDQVRRSTRSARRAPVRMNAGNSQYTVHVLERSGSTIREYVNAQGKVFAITWRGYRSPSEKVLLGKFYSELQSLRRERPRSPGARSLELQSSRFMAARSGHPRALRGRYLARDLIPAGVQIHELQ